MTRLTKLVTNCSTGVTEEIELSDLEIAEIEEQKILTAERDAIIAAQIEAKSAAKASAEAKLAALGLTPEEIAALR